MLRAVAATGGNSAPFRLDCGHDHPAARPDVPIGTEVDCGSCDRRELPRSLVKGRRTPTFDRSTVPPALLKNHLTTGWACLEVDAGSVLFIQDSPPLQATATLGDPVVIVPACSHRIVPSPGSRFAVQFYDWPR